MELLYCSVGEMRDSLQVVIDDPRIESEAWHIVGA